MTDVAGRVSAIIATYRKVDRDLDWIEPGAVPDGARVVISAFGHSSMVDARVPVGVGTLKSVGDTLMLDGQFLLEDSDDAKASFAIVKAMGGSLQWSFGFRVLKRREPTRVEAFLGAQNVLLKIDAFEVSPVIRGAGIGTRTVAAKRLEEHLADERQQHVETLVTRHTLRIQGLS